jgi:hypothetical protein
MDLKKEATQAMRVRLKATLTTPEEPCFPADLDWILKMGKSVIEERSVKLATLPTKLQHLLVLVLNLEQEFNDEHDRRCVEFFGKEEYDNERIEYGIYIEVQNDPRFNQAPRVWKMLERRVRRVWREALTTSEGYEVIYYIDTSFNVHETNLRKRTAEENEAELQEILASLPNQT